MMPVGAPPPTARQLVHAAPVELDNVSADGAPGAKPHLARASVYMCTSFTRMPDRGAAQLPTLGAHVGALRTTTC